MDQIVGYLVRYFDGTKESAALHNTLREAFEVHDVLLASGIRPEVSRVYYEEEGPVWRNGRGMRKREVM